MPNLPKCKKKKKYLNILINEQCGNNQAGPDASSQLCQVCYQGPNTCCIASQQQIHAVFPTLPLASAHLSRSKLEAEAPKKHTKQHPQ